MIICPPPPTPPSMSFQRTLGVHACHLVLHEGPCYLVLHEGPCHLVLYEGPCHLVLYEGPCHLVPSYNIQLLFKNILTKFIYFLHERWEYFTLLKQLSWVCLHKNVRLNCGQHSYAWNVFLNDEIMQSMCHLQTHITLLLLDQSGGRNNNIQNCIKKLHISLMFCIIIVSFLEIGTAGWQPTNILEDSPHDKIRTVVIKL